MSGDRFAEWAVVELFGHARIAGRVTAEQIGGAPFVRVDVPAIPGNDDDLDDLRAFTKFYGAGAVYAITPVDEVTARVAAAHFREQPIEKWGLPVQGRLVPVPIDVSDLGAEDDDWPETDEEGTL